MFIPGKEVPGRFSIFENIPTIVIKGGVCKILHINLQARGELQ
jgi:hypothetical protein